MSNDDWQPQGHQPPPQQPPYQPYQQQGYQPQYGQPPGWQPYQPPPRRRGPLKWAGIGCLGLVGLVVVIVAVAASHSSSSSLPSALPTIPTAAAQSAAPASSAAKAVAKTVATFKGSGTQKTATFTTSANWALSYSFDCTSFGYKGNFVVLTDNGSDFNGAMVNDLAMSKSAVTYAYGDAGTHYLAVNSECDWTIKVVDEG